MFNDEPYALHIFVPSNEVFGGNWVEPILGTMVKPLLNEFNDLIDWVWVTRYCGEYDPASPPMKLEVPEQYLLNRFYRYVGFRLNSAPDSRDQIHDRAIQLSEDAGCLVNPRQWNPYDFVGDLGSNRFIMSDATQGERLARAKLVARFVDSVVRLYLDSIVSDQAGKWTLESNAVREQNPNGSLFESVHHLMCNSTRVPTSVKLTVRAGMILLKTHWMREARQIPIDSEFEDGKNWCEKMISY